MSKHWNGKRPTDFALDVLRQSDEQLRKVAMETLRGVIVGSPVDEGAFRSNHRVSIGAPDASVTEGNGNKAPRGDEDMATMETGKQKILTAHIGDVVYIQNNLPYAIALENGHSKQAPLGVYAIAHLNAKNKFGL
ncbi:hypothetical protein EC844_12536 [Acinetobacter calcoaceticus]|uniref:HK97 gp10 family phage protein n=1 Tax=Acinetobacter calcoaceticus TaxID=471 RepID=A0A4V6NJ77_ACICA|nr:hypothetical protein EC844_12536 [Acinetobacter calcoaceticus]